MNDSAAIEIAEDAALLAHVLVVDDNGINRKKMRMAVENLGYTADVAKNGVEALEALRTNSFDAVLLDILMPEMDGFDVLSEMKKDDRMRDVPVIVISALDDETESVVKAIALGAEDFLPKSLTLFCCERGLALRSPKSAFVIRSANISGVLKG